MVIILCYAFVFTQKKHGLGPTKRPAGTTEIQTTLEKSDKKMS